MPSNRTLQAEKLLALPKVAIRGDQMGATREKAVAAGGMQDLLVNGHSAIGCQALFEQHDSE
jgi:hypothetical protein